MTLAHRMLGLVGCISIACAALMIDARHSRTAEPQRPIQASQLLRAPQIIGLLGKPLGSKVTVEGTRPKNALLENPLAVTKVDGQPLQEIVRLEVKHSAELKVGTRYTLEGYESGGFAGDPEWVNARVQQPFQYRPTFVVTRVIEPK